MGQPGSGGLRSMMVYRLSALGSIFNLSRGVDAGDQQSGKKGKEVGTHSQFAAAAKRLDAIKAAKLLL